MLPRRALSAHQGAKRQREVGDFAVRNQHASARRPDGRRAFRRRRLSQEEVTAASLLFGAARLSRSSR